ncbi:hypothetical protein PF008_g6031 [Phytophthora fragariae]|uniref:Uncharacterized protein n=1 Tax=Phytophthora fragariae TaxID=53985 RepID=A0A6G0S6M4_9STRA|nr:hypothetical protein PF008_g6031 [Phytophthora fragariae]
MEYLTTSSLPLDFYSGMLSRLYDIGFCSKGLSISHFGRIGYLERLRKAAKGNMDMTDFTLPVPASPVLSSWAQLHAATRGFLQYCSEMCDPTTICVAAALDNFALQLEGWNYWLPNEIPTLVLWINATKERYRNAAAHDSLSGASTRVEAAGWFSNANPELQSLLITAISERSARALNPARKEDPRRMPHENKSRQGKMPAERKVPAAVVEALPRKDRKEVCLRFLSKRGCASQDQAVCKFPNLVHFHPSEIDPTVREYINAKLGGVSDKYAHFD